MVGRHPRRNPTDAVQYVIIVIGVTLCAISPSITWRFDAMMSILYSTRALRRTENPGNWSLSVPRPVFSFLLGEFCAPYPIQRYASTKSAKDSKNELPFRRTLIFFMATTAAISLASMAIQPDVKPDLAFTNLIRDILPPGITGLVFGALLAAVMSTGAAMINTSAVIYTRDIYNKFINTAATQAQLLRQSRLSTLVVGGISIGVAIIFQDVFGLMIYMFKLWPSAILPPLMCGLLWGKISPYAGAPAVIAGGLSFFLWSDKVLGNPSASPPTSSASA
ncbi:MAG: sodium:solute symporter family protein [Bilophila wadsworthia]